MKKMLAFGFSAGIGIGLVQWVMKNAVYKTCGTTLVLFGMLIGVLAGSVVVQMIRELQEDKEP